MDSHTFGGKKCGQQTSKRRSPIGGLAKGMPRNISDQFPLARRYRNPWIGPWLVCTILLDSNVCSSASRRRSLAAAGKLMTFSTLQEFNDFPKDESNF